MESNICMACILKLATTAFMALSKSMEHTWVDFKAFLNIRVVAVHTLHILEGVSYIPFVTELQEASYVEEVVLT
jgi:hypothetical protein